MSSANLLRKAKPVNVREAQARLSKLIRSKSPSWSSRTANRCHSLCPMTTCWTSSKALMS